LLAELLEAAASRISNADLGRTVAGVRDEVDDSILAEFKT
jgi:hypothetical protein